MLTVTAALDAYLVEHVDEKVVDKFRQQYGADHVKDILGAKPLQAVDIPACRDYARQRSLDAAPSTIRRELNILSAAANHAKRWRRITAEQMPQIELPDVSETPPVEALSKEQIALLFDSNPLHTDFSDIEEGRFACFVRILYYTGARRNSVERLLKSQIDLTNGVIHLAQTGERKTKKRRPTVPLYGEIKPAVSWLLDASGTGFAFGASRSFYKRFVRRCDAIGILAHPHMLRHSRASHMLCDGESIYKVAKLLGDSVATVERVYGHFSPEFLNTKSGV